MQPRSEHRATVGEVVLPTPPELPQREGAGATLVTAIPMLGSVGAIVLVATMSRATGGRSLIAGGLFLLSAIGFVVIQLDRQRGAHRRQLRSSRADHLHRLGVARKAVRAAAAAERAALARQHPPPGSLGTLVAHGPPAWSTSRPCDDLAVRWGTAAGSLATRIVVPEAPARADPVAVAAGDRLAAVHRVLPDLPATVTLGPLGRIALRGPADHSRALARALVCSAAARHPPSQLRVAAAVDDARLPEWEWLKWLPHARSPWAEDGVGARRLVGRTWAELSPLLGRPDDTGEPAPPDEHLLLVVDRGDPDGPVDRPGVTVLDVAAPSDRAAPQPAAAPAITLAPGTAAPDGPVAARAELGGTATTGLADQLSRAAAEAFARRLAPWRHGEQRADPSDGLGELWDVGHLRRLDLDRAWRRRHGADRLRVPIGRGDDGTPVHLDLKESAEDGMGPHGLVVGATGSGKSELLRTLVLGLSLTHSPDQLNLVLVDFKGGATFAGLAGLPHVAAVITNLSEDLALVDRMQDALAGEMLRRQELLRAAGDLASVRDHEAARDQGLDRPPLPSLLVVIDEFSELLTARPSMLDLFVAVGRLGRSLGIHLLLATQRLEEGRLRGLDAHLSYRVGLRTFSAGESRAVLGVPDAATLPAEPGLGYLRTGPDELLRFRAAHVSGPLAEARAGHERPDPVHHILPFTAAEQPRSEQPRSEQPRSEQPGSGQPAPRPEEQPSDRPTSGTGRTLLEAVVGRLAGCGTPAHRIWLPPLDEPDTLDRLCPDLVEVAGLGLVSPGWRRRGRLTFPVGVVDRPREQRREPLVLSLTGAAGHVAVVGGPRSGRSTLLRTVIAGLALTSTPDEAQIFVLDLGGSLAGLAGLPHVSALAGRDEPEVVRRAVAEVAALVDRREAWFREQHLDGVDEWRVQRAAGGPDDGRGDVFLVIDGWGALRDEHEEVESTLVGLAQRGLGVGVHLILTAGRWADLRAPVRDRVGTRIELRLGDPLDSEVDRRAAATVPIDRPGRGLTVGGSHVLGALPRLDGDGDPDTTGSGLTDLVRRVAAAWTGPPAPPLPMLPGRVTLAQVRSRVAPAPAAPAGPGDPVHPGGGTAGLLLGLDEHDLAPVHVDPSVHPHLLVLGDGGAGKTGLLRTLAAEIARTRSPEQARIVAVDPRRTLLGDLPPSHLLDHVAGAVQAGPALVDLAALLTGRIPGPDVDHARLRARDWWQGAEVFVLVDDHDLVVTAGGSPLAPLLPLLPQARDVGLHLVVARRTGGAARALHEPVLRTLRDLAQPALLFSGDPDEGPLLGRLRPDHLPPGRARLVTRDRGVRVVQVAWTEPGP